MPPPPPHHQMEADEVQTVEADLLGGKVLRLAVEDRNAATMSDRRRRFRHPKAAGLPHANSVGGFGFLRYITINLSLSQPVKHQF